MSRPKARRLQYLVIKELLETGSVELILPDGVVLEIGIVQEDEDGDLHKTDDYCYVVATRQNKSTMLDSYNLGLAFEPDNTTIIHEDDTVGIDGKTIRTLDVV